MIRKLLVANRGEIAVRIFRTAQELGIRTVAVYSEADEHSLHRAIADESYPLTGSEPTASYLNKQSILEIAKSSGSDAIHPGYGFLSENAEFASMCESSGVVFVGPSAASMSWLGSKTRAKALAQLIGVPLVPGFFAEGATDEDLIRAAESIGYPVMLKASAGGGGRGMRAIHSSGEIAAGIRSARDEALKSFGNDAMMVEKLIPRPCHVEVQVLADSHGNVACLFERECSLQRRHQKVVEEAPSPLVERMGSYTWEELRSGATKLVRAADYTNAATVEFMIDSQDGELYFLEVNTRLQVEHPVTEAVTGLDLVAEQLRIASGQPLSVPDCIQKGDRKSIHGHALELRILAEDPAAGFAPSVGKILAWHSPVRPGVRVDSGYGVGSEVSRFYDSLLAKLIVHGPTRDQAIRKASLALMDFHVVGVKTNIGFLLELLDHPDVRSGTIDTGLMGRDMASWTRPAIPFEMGALEAHATEDKAPIDSNSHLQIVGAWAGTDGFRIAASR